MPQQPPRGFRGFVQRPVGRAVWLALTVGIVLGSFVSPGGALLAIPAFLIFGMGIPIFLGIKRARYIALSGLVVILLVAPLAGVVITSELLSPTGAAASAPTTVEWSVTVGNTTQVSQSGQIVFQLPNGSQPYTVSPVVGYLGTNRSGTVAVSGAASTVHIDFSPVTYGVTFSESNLPHGTTWGVSVDGVDRTTTTGGIVFDLSNGTYPYTVDVVAGYVATLASGNFRVAGGTVAVPVVYERVAYSTTFTESGLPSGAAWDLATPFGNISSSGASVVLELPNGSWSFTASSVPGYASPTGQEVVVAGPAASVTVPFSPVTYPVTFSETQLPAGTNWSVSVAGEVRHSVASSFVVDLANGTYRYEVGAVSGYTPDVWNTTIFVNGSAAQASVMFDPTAYVVTFNESGLADGTVWNVSIGATSTRSTGPSIVYQLPNETTNVTVAPVSGYSISVASAVTVNGARLSVPVRFTPLTYAVAFSETGLASGTNWSVKINGNPVSTTTGQVLFHLANGTYPYTLGAISGRTPPAASAVVEVRGAAVTVPVPFAATTYAVTFNESGLASGSGATVLQNATVAPFQGGGSTQFVWTVTVDPSYLSSTNSSPLWLNLYVSTCPGATSPNSSSCGSNYPFIVLTHYFCADPSTVASCEATVSPLTGPAPVAFSLTLSTVGVWEWQMGLAVENLSIHYPEYSLLVGDPQFNGIEGPVVGNFGQIFEFVVLYPTYLDALLYLGLPFYVVLLLYLFLKNRERRRKEARRRAAGPIPPTSAAGAGTPPAPIPSGGPTEAPAVPAPPPAGEVACPNCGAVVYPSEPKCWKCGSELPAVPAGGGASPPLPH